MFFVVATVGGQLYLMMPTAHLSNQLTMMLEAGVDLELIRLY